MASGAARKGMNSLSGSQAPAPEPCPCLPKIWVKGIRMLLQQGHDLLWEALGGAVRSVRLEDEKKERERETDMHTERWPCFAFKVSGKHGATALRKATKFPNDSLSLEGLRRKTASAALRDANTMEHEGRRPGAYGWVGRDTTTPPYW